MRASKEHAALAEALRHPLRVRILEVLNEQDMAPNEFVDGGYADFYFGHRPNVSHIAYHFRELHDFGCLEQVAWRKARGSVATTYRGTARAEFTDEQWAKLSEDEKRDISRTVAQGLMARIDGAFMADTFLARDDHQLSWFAMRLDERGWDEVHGILSDAFAAVSRSHGDAEARLSESEEKGVTATAGILFFESPTPTPPAERKRAERLG
jgi:DNA-binding transcriptional ArsR family regulator